MDHDEYVAARYTRLLEHAVELGCDDDVAAAHVDRVLDEQRRHIARAEDPDPGVREALARAVSGEAPVREAPWTALAVGAALLIVLVVAATTWWRPADESTLPSLFGYDTATATQVLADAGYDVVTSMSEACEPRGLVLGSEPAPGTAVRAGATVTLRSAVPSDPGCLATYGFRSDAWEFIGFVRGQAAPDFAPRVAVYVDGVNLALLSREAAAGRASWAAALALIEDEATQVAPTRSAMPRLVVDSLIPPRQLCGVTVPPSYEGGRTLRLRIDPSPEGADSLCPFVVDLYRDDDRRIEAVSIYTGISRDNRAPQDS